MAHVKNAATGETGCEFEINLGYIVKSYLLKKVKGRKKEQIDWGTENELQQAGA